MVITTLHHTGDRARPVSSQASAMSGWRHGSVAPMILGTTGLAMFATTGYGLGTSNCPAGAAKRTTTRPPRHLATRST